MGDVGVGATGGVGAAVAVLEFSQPDTPTTLTAIVQNSARQTGFDGSARLAMVVSFDA